MKRTKRLGAVFLAALLAAALLAVPAPTASAYTAFTPENGTVEHSLTLATPPYELLYTITYTFTVLDGVTTTPTAVASTVTGTPQIPVPAVYDSDTEFDDTTHTATQALTVDWSGVSFTAPGTYSWHVTGAVSGTYPETATNNNSDAYIYACVINDDTGASGLKLDSWGVTRDSGLSQKGLADDTYPASAYQLSLSKTVTGDMGEKDRYFKFTVNLRSPAGAADTSLTLGGYDPADTVNASPYNSGAVQPASPVTLTGNGGATTVEVWLKDGQTFTVAGLPADASYQITETENAGYDVSYSVDGGAAVTGSSTGTETMDAAATVAFTNDKEGTAPTGVRLEVAAPIAGIVVALGVGAVLLLSRKRRRNGNAE